jgi:anaerobic selenocysteine-containing dehydrogenase
MRKIATCTICEATCGIVVDVEGDRVVSVRGDPDDPASRGYVCPKVVGMQDLHEDPDRLRRPLVRDGGALREASWDEALARAADGLRRVRRAYGKDALAVYQGNPTAHNLGLMVVGQIALRTLGTKNLYSASSVDQVPHMRAAHDMFGHLVSMPVPDIDRTDLWLVVGANPLVSNGSVMTAPDVKRRIDALRARGGALVVVDPRRTETAALADRHIFLRPGADALFFFALLHVVFEERLASPGARLAPMLAGLDDLRALAERFSPERVARAAGVEPEALRDLARSFARARRAACYVRVGTCHQEHGTLASWLAYALAAVTGNLDREGGLMWTTPAAELTRLADLAGLNGHGRFTSRVRGMPETGGELPVAALAEEIEAPGEGRVRALVTCAGNPVLSAPNGPRLDRALAQLDFMVSIDPYLNETTRHAHVILPPCSPLQRPHYDLALNAFAVENVAKWVDPPLPRGDDEKDDAEIVRELVLRLRVGNGRRLAALRAPLARVLDPERLVDLLLRAGPYGTLRRGLSVSALRRSPHGVRLGPLEPRLPGILRTPSKKVELAPKALVAEVAALEATLSREVPPLVLVGRRHLRSNNSWLHNSRRLVKGPPRCTLLVHPDDARRCGVVDGGKARVTSARGSVEAVVTVTDEMMPGVVSLPHGWGHDKGGTRTTVAAEHAGVSVNDLTDESRVDRLTGNAAFSAVPVEVAASS